jgi:hypothetical protein
VAEWIGVSNNLQPLTITAGHPAIRISGDGTAGLALTSAALTAAGYLTCVDPGGFPTTRKPGVHRDGIRAAIIARGCGHARGRDPGNDFSTCTVRMQSGPLQSTAGS